jgi:hypothetical protein
MGVDGGVFEVTQSTRFVTNGDMDVNMMDTSLAARIVHIHQCSEMQQSPLHWHGGRRCVAAPLTCATEDIWEVDFLKTFNIFFPSDHLQGQEQYFQGL